MSETFDTLFPHDLDGVVTLFQIVDPDGTPNRVLEITRDWQINVEWVLDGTGVDCLGGTWHVQVSLESMGAHFEGQVGPIVDIDYADYDPVQSNASHCHWKLANPIVITTAEMQAKNIEPGVYKPVLLITYENTAGDLRPMAGFMDAGLITLYKPN